MPQRKLTIQVTPEELKTSIKFGTSGWRARMDTGEYTMGNVSRVASAIADELISSVYNKRYTPVCPEEGLRVLVAFDARKGSEEFATRVVEVLAASEGVRVYLGNDIATTPAVIAMTRESLGKNAFDLAIHITASHNDTRYNGIKILQSGVVAPDALTALFAKRANAMTAISYVPIAELQVERVPIVEAIMKRYETTFPMLVPQLTEYRKKHPEFSLVVDVMHGSAGPFVGFFERVGAKIVRKEPMKLETFPRGAVFPEDGEMKIYRPEPKRIFLSAPDIEAFEKNAADGSLYIAIDGDGDRCAVWTKSNGSMHELIPNDLGVLYGWYLHKYSRTKNVTHVCKTLPTTNGMKAVAEWAGLELTVTPVGSKYFAPHMKDSSRVKALVGVEESGHHGMTVGQETWFDDAVCQALILLEILAVTGEYILINVEKAGADIGFRGYYRRKNKDLSPELKNKIIEPLSKQPQELAKRIASLCQKTVQAVLMISMEGTVEQLETLLREKRGFNLNEGMNVQFTDKTWVQFRLSGTEPVARTYVEGRTSDERDALEKALFESLGI